MFVPSSWRYTEKFLTVNNNFHKKLSSTQVHTPSLANENLCSSITTNLKIIFYNFLNRSLIKYGGFLYHIKNMPATFSGINPEKI